jgi:hypothetical protein
MNALGREITRKGKNDGEKLALLENYYQGAKLNYGTAGMPMGKSPLEEFLFEKKKGNCEFFASSFALLLRSAGIPTRLVGGYYGGEYNPLGGYYVITEDMAHVWVESYVEGRGWVTIDPSIWAVNFPGMEENRRKGILQSMSMAMDALGYFWNLSVINYDLDRQLRFLHGVNVGMKRISLTSIPVKQVTVTAFFLAGAACLLVQFRRKKSGKEERILKEFLKKVGMIYGIERDLSTGLDELARPLENPEVNRFVAVYGRAVYRDRTLSHEEYTCLKVLVKELH